MRYAWFKTKKGLLVLNGDLIAAFKADEVNVVAHGINPLVMGAGFAELLRLAVHEKHGADLVKSTFNMASQPKEFDVVVTPFYHDMVINMVTQPRPGPFASLSGLERCLSEVAKLPDVPQVDIPFVGAGIGGLPPAAAFNMIDLMAGEFVANHKQLVMWLHEPSMFNRMRDFATTEGRL